MVGRRNPHRGRMGGRYRTVRARSTTGRGGDLSRLPGPVLRALHCQSPTRPATEAAETTCAAFTGCG